MRAYKPAHMVYKAKVVKNFNFTRFTYTFFLSFDHFFLINPYYFCQGLHMQFSAKTYVLEQKVTFNTVRCTPLCTNSPLFGKV